MDKLYNLIIYLGFLPNGIPPSEFVLPLYSLGTFFFFKASLFAFDDSCSLDIAYWFTPILRSPFFFSSAFF